MERPLPEITVKVVLLAIILALVLGAANIFLGLKVGLTISASIPAAVISMGILRLFSRSNILENNIVQTAASAGEALAAGCAFTLPALVVIRYWVSFPYWESVFITVVGGTLGVLFSVPLRRVLLSQPLLHFPEGTAIANVLLSTEQAASGMKTLVLAGVLGATMSALQTGFQVIAEGVQYWWIAGKWVFGVGIGFSPALIGAGYIIGFQVGLSILLGIVMGWLIGVPLIGLIYGLPEGATVTNVASLLWDQYMRYVGLGVMMVGGVWAIAGLLKPMWLGLRTSVSGLQQISDTEEALAVPRQERDLPLLPVLWGVIILMVPAYMICALFGSNEALHLPNTIFLMVTFVSLWFIILGGFLFAAICGYFAGLVGSSTNPLSSMALLALILVSLMVTLILHGHLDLSVLNDTSIVAAALAIAVTAVIACAAAICNDTIQDLKTGQMVGATPWKQQVMMLLGVVVAAVMIPFVLELLFQAYGLAGVFPREGMDHSQMLLAPQASLMAAVVDGIFTQTLPWGLLGSGASLAVALLWIERQFLKPRGWQLPILAVGLGIYLPITTASPLVIGGLLACWVEGPHKNTKGILLASGLVAGAALMGVLLAIPFAIQGDTNALRLVGEGHGTITNIAGIAVTVGLCLWIKHRLPD